jgi:hypothetical protein
MRNKSASPPGAGGWRRRVAGGLRRARVAETHRRDASATNASSIGKLLGLPQCCAVAISRPIMRKLLVPRIHPVWPSTWI